MQSTPTMQAGGELSEDTDMNFNRFRDPLIAALGALLIGGASVAMANSPSTAASPSATNAEQPVGAPDTDNIQDPGEGDDGEGADDAGSEAQDPNYAGAATIPVDESTLPEDDAAEAQALAALATVSQADAETAALAAQPGEVLRTELDNENGFVVWSVEIRDASGGTHDVAIDAGSGAVLGNEPGGDDTSE